MTDKNLTRSEDHALAEILETAAQQVDASPSFKNELEKKLMNAHKPKVGLGFFSVKKITSTVSWAFGLAVMALIFIWVIRSIAPQPQPAAGNTPFPNVETATPESLVPENTSEAYEWRGTKLYLAQPLPGIPTEANVYVLKPDQHATIEEARALAARFGIQGEVYMTSGLYPETTGYFITDGKQSLSISSSQYFSYTADLAKAYNDFNTATNPNAEKVISDFLKSRGFDFPYRINQTELYSGYVVEPLSPDGFPMRYEYFSSRPMLVTFDENGQVLRLEASLLGYDQKPTGTYGIITAKDAFQKIFEDSNPAGKIESGHSTSKPIKEWRRVYPANETITIYGYASSIPALDTSKPPFTQIDGYTVTGNFNGMNILEPNTYIEATGQFIIENGIEKFNIEAWKASKELEDGLVGTLHRDGQQVILSTPDQGEYTLVSDVPADVPMPFENAYVIGVKIGNTFDWDSIDDRMTAGGGGGGGGGGGLGFYKLNLSGTPAPFSTSTPVPSSSGEGNYVVKAGDTLSSIAQSYGITADELMKANNLDDTGMIFVDQQLVIPGAQSSQPAVGQRIEGQRGIMNIVVYNKPDGSQRVEYTLIYMPVDQPYSYAMLLEGENLQTLQAYQNRPVEIWGVVDRYDNQHGMATIKVERFETPFPDLQFQIMRGTQKNIEINGQPVTLFTSEEGVSYVSSMPGGDTNSSLIGNEGDQVILEALAIPDETFGGYPTLRIFSGGMAINPKNGEPIELTITADQPYIGDEPAPQEDYIPPTATIEKVELIYYVTNQRWQVDHLDGGTQYIQPVWKFSGHYSNGDEFEILVQALKQEYLLPELAPYIQGG